MQHRDGRSGGHRVGGRAEGEPAREKGRGGEEGEPRHGADLEPALGYALDPRQFPDPSEGEEGSAIQFSMVCDVEAGVMWLAPGQPCVTEFEELRLADLL